MFNQLRNINDPMNYVLNLLQQRNPSAYSYFMELKNSGRNPNTIFNELYSNLTPEQKQMMSMFGNQFKAK